MRRAVFVVLLAAACGDPSRPAKAAPADAAPDAASDASLDDAALEARVLDAARTGNVDRLSALKLPPRVSRVRVAVHALHDDLLGVAKDPPPRASLLAAFDALARCEGGADAGSLAQIAVVWRTWTDAQAADERTLASRAAQCLDALRRDDVDAAKLSAPLAGAPSPPARSPAAAELAFSRLAALVVAAKGDAMTKEIGDASTSAQKLFLELGWPGGFGTMTDALLPRLLHKSPNSFLATFFADSARAAYVRSGDEVRASLVFLAQADAMSVAGDAARAERLADAARERFLATGARGREFVDVLRRHGELAQVAGKQAVAARDLSTALAEAKSGGLDAATRLEIEDRLATSLFRLGRFAEAYDVARDVAKAAPDRPGIVEVEAESALELGRFAEAAELYREGAARSQARSPDEAVQRRLLRARALAKGGDASGAAKAVAEVLAGEARPPWRAFAAGVLREARLFDDAERELSRAESEGGADFAASIVVERARLAADRGDSATARALFGRTVDALEKDAAGALVGWDLASPLLDWARMEERAGRLFEASELAGRAVVQLDRSGLDMELDRARKLYVDLQRRRGWFLDAEKVTGQRIDARDVGDDARREDALLDLLLVRIELTQQRRADAEKNALAAAQTFAEGWRRDLASACVRAAAGAAGEIPAPPADASPRWRLLHDVAAGASTATELVKRCVVAAEPELRRWAASREFGGTSDECAVELRRQDHEEIEALLADTTFVKAADEAVLIVEPTGDKTELRLRMNGDVFSAQTVGDAGLADFWDACWVAPSPKLLAAAAQRVSDAFFPKRIADRVAGARRLWISVAEPLGPLPFDLLPFGEGKLLDRCEVLDVSSLSEFARCRGRASPAAPEFLVSPYATLDARHALVEVGAVDPKIRARFLQLVAKARATGKDVSAAVRDAKLALRAEWKPDPKAPPTLPPWAAFLLRGAL